MLNPIFPGELGELGGDELRSIVRLSPLGGHVLKIAVAVLRWFKQQ